MAELIFPRRCAGCGRMGAGVCAACLGRLAPLPAPRCRQCCRPLAYGVQCASCRLERRRVDWVYVHYPFQTPLREAVHRLKYDNKRYLAAELASIAVGALDPATAIDAIVPVPLYPTREAERGYNQSALIARAVGELIDRPVAPDLLRRHRPTPPQTSLARADRLQNVRGAFAAATAARGLRVLLVDDVLTTGATVDACARALRRVRAQWVGALVVAHQPADPLPAPNPP